MAQVVVTIFSDLPSEEFVKLVKNTGFANTMELAAFIGARDKTVRPWMSGAKNIPKSVAMLLAVMQHFDLSATDVLEITREGSRS